jgi:uncharacterized protein
MIRKIMAHKVLITGGTGLIGKNLTAMLLKRGYEVALLSRKKEHIDGVKVFEWDIEKDYLEEGALENTSYLIHLAGAGVAEKRWTKERKKVITESRTKSIELISSHLQKTGNRPKAFVSASGISYYGEDTGNRHHIEESPAGNDFLSHVTLEWEKAAETIAELGVRTVKLRTGIVLSHEGGALKEMALPARFGLGAPLGSGKQWISWIHIDDICRMYVEAMENESWEGPYNAVASSPVTNKDLTKEICKVLHRPQWLPNVPSFALRVVFGEMANVVLGSSYVVNWRVQKETNFSYKFPELRTALQDVLDK